MAVAEALVARLCRRCGRREAPSYHDWCGACHAARRRERERERQAAHPARAGWVRDWNRLRMRAYRGHEMREEPCRGCGEKGTLMLLGQNPLVWTVLCRPCRAKAYPGRDVTGWAARRRIQTRQLQRETQQLGL